MTVIPASIALMATSVSAAPSKGSMTMASTLSLMKVSIWLICRFTSLVPSATMSSTSEYVAASACAASVMAAIQPWSAAGAEKPIRTVSPGASFAVVVVSAAADPAAAVAAASLVSVDVELFVHPAMSALAATTIPSVVTSLVLRALMISSFCGFHHPGG